MTGGDASCAGDWAPQSSPPARGLGHSGYDFAGKGKRREKVKPAGYYVHVHEYCSGRKSTMHTQPNTK